MSDHNMVIRRRVGRVSIYEHHGSWWTYHRNGKKHCRRRIGSNRAMAECEASLLNAELAAAEANLSIREILTRRFESGGSEHAHGPDVSSLRDIPRSEKLISVAELRNQFLEHHEKTLCSALATVDRYRTATLYLQNFLESARCCAAEVSVLDFIRYLRSIEIAPNGHAHTARRKLRDKGVQYIVECCRSMYHFGIRQKILPRDLLNPFSSGAACQLRIRDAKPIFVFLPEQELKFFQAASEWAFAIHFVLAKTGLRTGELTHLLIEEVDLQSRWLQIRSKPELGWITKTTRERRVPLIEEVARIFQHVIGERCSGIVFLRRSLGPRNPPVLTADRARLAEIACQRIQKERRHQGRALSRHEEARVLRSIWMDAGAVPEDLVRQCFIRAAKAAGLSGTCPKSWRHTFATLMQQANVDLLVRQETLGHRPMAMESSVLGMTGIYTHTTPQFQRQEIERALRLRPESLALAQCRVRGDG
jgi:integrase